MSILFKPSLGATLRFILLYLPIFLVCLYNIVCYYQDIQPALQRLEEKLKVINQSIHQNDEKYSKKNRDVSADQTVVIGLVACGSGSVRISELNVVLKSAILFSKHPLKFVIFADKLQNEIVDILTKWNNTGRYSNIDWDIREPTYPEGSDEMVSLFVPCATQRLFFPEILVEYSRILYVDTDFVFLNSPYNTWKYFDEMDKAEKNVGMSIENLDRRYSMFTYAHHPSPESGGLNSGMMLMNLDGLRQSHWLKSILAINSELSQAIVFGDQDILNTLFYYFPEDYFILPCTANLRLDYCLPSKMEEACPEWKKFVEESENEKSSLPLMLHGSRGAFHDNWKLWDLSFFTSYFPNMVNWFIFKNVHLIEYAFKVQPIMKNQFLFKKGFRVFLDYDMEEHNTNDLKDKLSISLKKMSPRDSCYEIKDFIVNAIKVE